jgi:hypothetical protein
MTSRWTTKEMLALGRRHAEAEARCDLEATMATLVADPHYEFWPVGLGMRGRAPVRRYYEHLMGSFIPSTRGYTLLAEWVSETSVAQEYEIRVEVDGAVEAHRVVGILFAEGELLGGERVYAGERCMRLMVGALFDELTPIRLGR